jgi:hypothetical protein
VSIVRCKNGLFSRPFGEGSQGEGLFIEGLEERRNGIQQIACPTQSANCSQRKAG